jgi:nucleoside-diphosphate-sugar epimerase
VGDLREQSMVTGVIDRGFDEVYQLAADMGGAGYIFTGEHDADIMHNSATINLNVADRAMKRNIKKVFYSSSACMYPAYNQEDPDNPNCAESSAYPAAPDSEYGWEKLFSERLFGTAARQTGMVVRTGRLHNVYGPDGTWRGGREKAPAAICRKVAEAANGGAITLWGDGRQLRSFMYVDDCIEGIVRLMRSDVDDPLNLGSDEVISIGDLAAMVIGLSGKRIAIEYTPGPLGVGARSSDNTLIAERLGWAPSIPLRAGIEQTYAWIRARVEEETGRRKAV